MDVKIQGKTYCIRSNHDAQFTRQAADIVDSKVKELNQKMGPVAPERLATLAAMNLAGELIQVKQEIKNCQSKLTDQIEIVLEKINAELGE